MKRFIIWFVINSLFLALIVAGGMYGVVWAGNVVGPLCVFLALKYGALVLVPKDTVLEDENFAVLREDMRPTTWYEQAYDYGVMGILASLGWYFSLLFYFISCVVLWSVQSKWSKWKKESTDAV